MRLFCASANTNQLIDHRWYPLQTNYTHAEIGEIIGGTRVTVSRLIGELSNEGFTRILNRRIQVNADAYKEMMTWFLLSAKI